MTPLEKAHAAAADDRATPSALIGRQLAELQDRLQRAANRLARDATLYAHDLRDGRMTSNSAAGYARSLADAAALLDRLAARLDAMRDVHGTYQEQP